MNSRSGRQPRHRPHPRRVRLQGAQRHNDHRHPARARARRGRSTRRRRSEGRHPRGGRAAPPLPTVPEAAHRRTVSGADGGSSDGRMRRRARSSSRWILRRRRARAPRLTFGRSRRKPPRPECLRKTETPASGLAGVSDIERDVRMGGPIHFIGCLGLQLEPEIAVDQRRQLRRSAAHPPAPGNAAPARKRELSSSPVGRPNTRGAGRAAVAARRCRSQRSNHARA